MIRDIKAITMNGMHIKQLPGSFFSVESHTSKHTFQSNKTLFGQRIHQQSH